jgi:hypothetical protein
MGSCCNTKSGKINKFLILLLLDLLDVAVNWFFYTKVVTMKPGLVYGPVNPKYRWSILAFCIVGSLTLVLETMQNVDDLRRKKLYPCLTHSLTNFMNIVLEDVPLLTLNLILAVCHDGNVTVISLVKATVCIVIIVIRVLVMIVYWTRRLNKSRFEYICDVLSTIGLFYAAAVCISIQLLNIFPIDNKGFIVTENPDKFNRFEFVRNKYLHDVGVYANWPIDSLAADNSNKIWLCEIEEILKHGSLHVAIRSDADVYVTSSQAYNLCTTKLDGNECFRVHENSTIEYLSSNYAHNASMKYGFDILFEKKLPVEFQYLAGYIDYAINRVSEDSNGNKKCFSIGSTKPMIYAKYPLRSANLSFLKFNDEMGSYSFYDQNYDLHTASKIWKTGLIGCDSTGDLGPKLSSNINLSC